MMTYRILQCASAVALALCLLPPAQATGADTTGKAHHGPSHPRAGVPDANGVFWACYNTVSQAVRVIDRSRAACKSNEVMIHWNQVGEQGPQGVPGAAGARGPAGTVGAAGPQGPVGAAGAIGPMGPQGLAGANGAVGPMGPQGPAGANGAAGLPGEQGPIGPQGPAAPRAAGPCYNNDRDRYQDCGNGTVTDTATGLIWLKDANCFGQLTWSQANQAAASLAAGTAPENCGLTDNSSAGDWRLPTYDEWFDTVKRAGDMNCELPVLTDAYGGNCFNFSSEPQFLNVGNHYWSSTTFEESPTTAWALQLDYDGWLDLPGKGTEQLVWPVRSSR